MSEKIICPKCGSDQLTAQKKGFSGKKAVAGALLTGGIGLLAGTIGSKDIDITCIACGHRWEPKSLAAEKERQETAKSIEDRKKWKQKFYQAFESNNKEEANRMFLQNKVLSTSIPDINKAYKHLKKSDNQTSIITISMLAVLILIVFFVARACS